MSPANEDDLTLLELVCTAEFACVTLYSGLLAVCMKMLEQVLSQTREDLPGSLGGAAFQLGMLTQAYLAIPFHGARVRVFAAGV